MKPVLDSFIKSEDRPWGTFLVYHENRPLGAEWTWRFFEELAARYPEAERTGKLAACRDQWVRGTRDEAMFTVKLLKVAKDSRLSLQFHNQRSEHWFVLNGSAMATIGNSQSTVELGPGDSTFIPRKAVHRLASRDGAVVLEIAHGKFDEDDIVRLEDDYSRIRKRKPRDMRP